MKALEKPLDAYIKDKHTQQECIGFIDGFEQGASLSLKLLEELMQRWEGYKLNQPYASDFAKGVEAGISQCISDLKGVLEHLKGEKETQD